jgi:hypothetical protein
MEFKFIEVGGRIILNVNQIKCIDILCDRNSNLLDLSGNKYKFMELSDGTLEKLSKLGINIDDISKMALEVIAKSKLVFISRICLLKMIGEEVDKLSKVKEGSDCVSKIEEWSLKYRGY